MRLCVYTGVLFALLALPAAQTARLFNCNNPGNLCSNGGTCNFFTGLCDCLDGFEGEDCRIRSAFRCPGSSSLDCGADGICVVLAGTAQCSCNAGYSGVNCEVAPMSCQCDANSMTIRMTPPGDFSNGVGYVDTYRGVAECRTTRESSNSQTMTVPYASSRCGNLARTNLGSDGGYVYSRTFRFRYNAQILTNNGIEFTCNCVFSPTNGVLYATIGNMDSSNMNNLIKTTATGYQTPVTYSMKSNGVTIRADSNLIIGDQIRLTITADAGYCVMVDSIEVNNTMTGSLAENATLLQNGCRTSPIGTAVLKSELVPSSGFSEWVVDMSAFLLDNSNDLIFTINYRAYTSISQCFQRSCAGTGRRKRQAGNQTAAQTPESTGNIVQIININPPASSEPTPEVPGEECNMSSNVLVGLIVMAGVICVLLVVCFVVGMRMIMSRKRDSKSPPSYVQ